MQFTFESYAAMLKKLHTKGYHFKNYNNWQETECSVILRHDVDYSLEKAALLSEIEKSVFPEGVQATYFVLVSTNFYNIHSRTSRELMRQIMDNGGIIGLHFDETQYDMADENELQKYVREETDLLSGAAGTKINVVSMHRPSEKFLSAEMEFPGIINSYSNTYFKSMKYVSDSRRHWRENVDEVIGSMCYQRLHILTHPFWYMQGEESSLKETLQNAVLQASLRCYDNLNDNFRDLDMELNRLEIERIVHGISDEEKR